MARRLLSGGEAVAYAALGAGASIIAGYPTDSLSRLVEAAIRQVSKRAASGAYAQWTVNDNTTLGICAAASISGLRSLAAFNQTGFSKTVQGIAALNHADLQGGFVAVVTDEPARDAFATNLDVRRICALAKIPVIDPETADLAYGSVAAAFTLSEKYNTPVVIHISSDINNTSSLFNIQTHTKSAPRKGTFLKNKDSIDVADLINDDSQEFVDFSDNNISDIDARLKEIAYRFSYKEVFAPYNRIFDFEQQYGGKHNSKRLAKGNEDLAQDSITDKAGINGISQFDESNIKIGICVCGSAAPYALEAIERLREEALKSKVSTPFIRLLTLGTPYPVPKRTLRKFLDGMNHILVIEEFSSFTEEELIKQSATSFLGPSVHGRFTDEVNYNYPINFETSIMHIAAFIDKCLNVKLEKGFTDPDATAVLSPIVNLGRHSSPVDNSKNLTPKQSKTLTGIARRLASPESIYSYNYEIPDRPPVLCAGCPHRASFFTIDKALARLKISRKDVVVSGDAGCSVLGNNPPLDFLDAYLGEGFSTSLAQGFSLSMPYGDGNTRSIAILGDSSFFAEAIPSITNAVVADIDVTIIILDNKTCAESGLQPTPTTYDTANIADVIRSLGVKNVREANPFEIGNAVDSCVKALRDPHPSAVVLSSKCARMTHSSKVAFINVNKCTGRKECITQLGCPAISFDKDVVGKKSGSLGQAVIDINQCNGCRLCIQACPSEAIRVMMYKDVAELLRQERKKAADNANEKMIVPEKGESGVDLSQTESEEEQETSIFDLLSSNSFTISEEDIEAINASDDEPDEEVPVKEKRTPLVSKEYVQAEFGTLFGGRNAELRLSVDDEDEILEEKFEADINEAEESDYSAEDAIADDEDELAAAEADAVDELATAEVDAADEEDYDTEDEPEVAEVDAADELMAEDADDKDELATAEVDAADEETSDDELGDELEEEVNEPADIEEIDDEPEDDKAVDEIENESLEAEAEYELPDYDEADEEVDVESDEDLESEDVSEEDMNEKSYYDEDYIEDDLYEDDGDAR